MLPLIVQVSATAQLNVPVDVITKSLTVLLPCVLVIVSVPEMVVVPFTVSRAFDIVVVPEFTFTFPETLKRPVALPVIEAPLMSQLPLIVNVSPCVSVQEE